MRIKCHVFVNLVQAGLLERTSEVGRSDGRTLHDSSEKVAEVTKQFTIRMLIL